MTTIKEQRDILIGESVDEVVDDLRSVGIAIEGGLAHCAHAILRSAMTRTVERVNDLENNKALQR